MEDSQKEFLRDLADLLQKHNVAIVSKISDKNPDYSVLHFCTAYSNKPKGIPTLETNWTYMGPFEARRESGMTSKEANAL